MYGRWVELFLFAGALLLLFIGTVGSSDEPSAVQERTLSPAPVGKHHSAHHHSAPPDLAYALRRCKMMTGRMMQNAYDD